jgi:putative hydrolase of the HAD superfamily
MAKRLSTLAKVLHSPALKAVAVDADDTLWHDHKYFRQLKSVLTDCAAHRGIDGSITIGALNSQLRDVQAGEVGYAEAVRRSALALGISGGDFDLIQRETARFLKHPVELLSDAKEALFALSVPQKVLITKGQLAEQERKLSMSGLGSFFERIFIVERKNVDALRGLLASLRISGHNALVIGNSIRHDIIPAVQNEMHAVWLDHPDNYHGRNAVLPKAAWRVESWGAILGVLATRSYCGREGLS